MGVNTDLEVLTPASTFDKNTALSVLTELPFDVDEAVRDNVDKFLQQQRSMPMEFQGPPDS